MLYLAAQAGLHCPLCICFLKLPYTFVVGLACPHPQKAVCHPGEVTAFPNLSTMLGTQRGYTNRCMGARTPLFVSPDLLSVPYPCSPHLSCSHWHPDHVSAVPISGTGGRPCESGKQFLPPWCSRKDREKASTMPVLLMHHVHVCQQF